MFTVGLATLFVVAGRSSDMASAAGRDGAAASSFRQGIGSAVVQAGPDVPVERISVPKLRSLLLIGSLGTAALLAGWAVWRLPGDSGAFARREESRRSPIPRAPPLIGVSRP
jgi:hypothetical protein